MGKQDDAPKDIGRIASKAMRKPQKMKKREIRALGASALASLTERAKAAARARRGAKVGAAAKR